jgi:hypothetical protein
MKPEVGLQKADPEIVKLNACLVFLCIFWRVIYNFHYPFRNFDPKWSIATDVEKELGEIFVLQLRFYFFKASYDVLGPANYAWYYRYWQELEVQVLGC